MPLNINPTISNFANSAWDSITDGASAVGDFFSGGTNSADATVDRLSGGAGVSGALNGFTSGQGSNTALGGISDTVNNVLGIGGDAIDGLTDSISSFSTGDIAGGISGGFNAIADAAGAVNDLVSKLRGQSLPAGAELFTGTGEAMNLNITTPEDWRVRIATQFSYFKSSPMFAKLEDTGGVVFPVLPTVSLATSANYTNIEPIHNNYPFPAYKNSQVDDISIDGQFPCETENDAAYWIAATTFFRTMTKMFYGVGDHAGNPPPVCYLYGYGSNIFDKVPVVVKNFSVDMPKDVQYIKCSTYMSHTTWVPMLSNISVTLQPIYNRANLRKFSLQSYASGDMISKSGARYL
jgi:hypothetical protein